MIIWLLFLGTYLLFGLYPVIRLRVLNNKILVRKESRFISFGLVALFFLTGMIVYLFIVNEKYIYFWDYGNYYVKTLEMKKLYIENPLAVLSNAYQTSVNNDYGTWVSSIIAYPFKFTKCRYIDYIMLLYITFAIPVAMSVSGLVVHIFNKGNKYNYLICNCMIILFPWFLVPMLKGYPGIAALLPITCSLWLLFGIGMDKLKIYDAVMLSLALIYSVLLRRYFAFWVLGFVVASVVYSVACWIRDGKKKEELIKYVTGYVVTGAVSLFILIGGMRGFIRRVIFENYKGQYVAYSVGNFLRKCISFGGYWGILLFVLLGFSLAYIALTLKEYIPVMLFCVVFEAVAITAFFRVQSPGAHHHWIFFLPLLIPIEMLILSYIDSGKKKIAGVLCICVLYNAVYVYSGSCTWWNYHSIICQRSRYEIRVRNDIEEIESLCSYLEQIQNDSKIYCVASGVTLNADILRAAYLPGDCDLNLAPVSDVDLRDGFPLGFLDSDIVITTEPVQTHLVEGTQKVVTLLQKEFEGTSSKIAEHFEKIKEFTLDNEVKVCIYRKTKEFLREDICYLQTLYDEHYPDNKALFYDRLQSYIETMQ